MQTLTDDAVRLGFADAQGSIRLYGRTTDGGGYFLNIVGSVYVSGVAQSGVWGRLRVNGDGSHIPTFSPSITQYTYSDALGGWTSDGSTLAPSWVANVGVIA